MIRFTIFFVTLTLFIISCQGDFSSTKISQSDNTPSEKSKFDPTAIYGDDNRLDLYQVNDENLLAYERAVAGILYTDNLEQNPNGTYSISTLDYGPSKRLCSNEPFYHQKRSTHCTGFLVGEDLLATAGHCAFDQEGCDELSFVFGISHYNKDEKFNYNAISKDNVYFCKKLIVSEYHPFDKGGDYALVRLDRKVIDRKPLKIRRYSKPSFQTKTVLIGKPLGLPTKIAAGGKVTGFTKFYFQSDNDAYHGNSGSPVININTGQVEGILVKGSKDYLYDKNKKCNYSNVCEKIDSNNKNCRGEYSQFINPLASYIDQVNSLVYENNTTMKIPDKSSVGVQSQINVNSNSDIKLGQLLVHMNIEHTWTGDLSIRLTSPNGDELTLFNNPGEYGENIVLTYGETETEQQNLKKITKEVHGQWTLHIVDEFTRDTGELKNWAIEFN